MGRREGGRVLAVASERASTQPDTIVGTVRFRTLHLKNFSRSKSHLCPFYSNKDALLCFELVTFLTLIPHFKTVIATSFILNYEAESLKQS